jgi:hypothetical protein
MLRKASHTLYVNGKMDHDEMHNYHMAVTEREVINGCLNVKNVKVPTYRPELLGNMKIFFYKSNSKEKFWEHADGSIPQPLELWNIWNF